MAATNTATPTLASRRWRWLAIPAAVLGVGSLLTVPVLAMLPSSLVGEAPNGRLGVDQPAPYARIPGAAQPVDERITFGDLGDVAVQYPPEGDIYFVTVSEPKQSLLGWLVGGHNPAIDWMTDEEKNGGFVSPQQEQAVALDQMSTAEQRAQFVAMSIAGLDPQLVPGVVKIDDIVCLAANSEGTACAEWAPANDVLQRGDTIRSVDGTPVATLDELSDLLAGREPGDVVSIHIERPGEGELDVEVPLTAATDEPDRAIIGFYPFDTSTVDLPFELDIDTGRIGGPSAGLAFTLTLIDELTPGELTGGRSVAVTGTIRLDGSVGAIGGLPQKASAVQQTGVEVFLVPAEQGDANIAAARAAAPGLEIIPVDNVDEALAALARLGGDPLP